jgi:predicted DsbA family dithiol-disulfide isomerase
LNARYGDEFHERLKQSFAASGLVYNPPPHVVPNTRRALRVTELARDRGLHRQVHDRLMQAYWEEGRDIGDASELLEIVVEAGLDEAEAAGVMGEDDYRDRVLASTREAQSIGINGIPAFLLDGRLLVLGAQPRAVFEQALAQLDRQHVSD